MRARHPGTCPICFGPTLIGQRISFAQCDVPGRPNDVILQPGGLPWHLNLSSYNAANGVARGTISKIHISMSQTPTSCTAMIDGTSATAHDGRVVFRYTDSTGQLKLALAGDLHFYDVSNGCLGTFNSGDPATLTVTYAVSPKQVITCGVPELGHRS